MTLTAQERADLTYRWDKIRGGAQGVIEACAQTFGLLIAIRVFQAPGAIKALIQAAWAMGFLISPLTVFVVSGLGMRSATICSLFAVLGAIGFYMVSVANHLSVYTFGYLLAMMAIAQGAPLVTQIYATNYSPQIRGKRYSTTFLLTGLVGGLFSYFGGHLLDINMSSYALLYFMAGITTLLFAFAYFRIPSTVYTKSSAGNPWQNISLLWQDKVFGLTMIAWSLLGLGSIMTFPIRIEYMANPEYGINASNEQIGLILGAIPLIVRTLSTKVWGYLFDAWNMVVVRVMLNVIMLTSILIYFNTRNLWIMGLAASMFGLSYGGGRIMWQLGVTKLAPPEKTSAYMSVHSALTGIRGLMAPFIGYALFALCGPEFFSAVSVSMIAVSIILFLRTYHSIEGYRQRDIRDSNEG